MICWFPDPSVFASLLPGSSPPKPPVSKVSIETQTEQNEVVEEDVDVSNVEIKPWTNDEMLKVLKKMQMSLGWSDEAPKKNLERSTPS